MIPKHIFALVAMVAFLNGCCCAASDFSESTSLGCNTYDQSCQKTCSTLGSADYSACVDDCRSTLASEGMNPDACCSSENTVRTVCEIECDYDPTFYEGSGTCMENCGDFMYQYSGLGPNDCIIPA